MNEHTTEMIVNITRAFYTPEVIARIRGQSSKDVDEKAGK